MATVAELYYNIGTRIQDPSNTRVEPWQLLRWINQAIRDTERKSNHLKANIQLSGQRRVVVKDYSSLSGDILSLKTSNDSAETDYTEASEWTAETSNAVTATNIATALDAHPDVEAYASFDNANTTYAYVYITSKRGYTISTFTSDADTDYMDVDNNGHEIFELSKIITNFRQVRNIYDTDQQLFYRPYTRQQYDRTQNDSEYAGYGYYVDPLYKMYIKIAGGNLDSGDTFKMDYSYWSTALTAATESPAGILAYFDELIIQKVMYYYFQSEAKYNDMNVADGLWRTEVKELQQEIKSQGELQPLKQFYQWH